MDKKITRQIALEVSGLHVREVGEGEEKSRTIEGHAVVFGVRSVNLTPWSDCREVYEIMEPGSIDQELLDRSDVVLTAFHDNTAILGRWRFGKGTLKLSLDARGLRIECTLANTARADELLSAIERGDITGMSFAYETDENEENGFVTNEKLPGLSEDGKEVWIRRVKKVRSLYDVTIAGFPAYPQTDVAQRELDDFFDESFRECGKKKRKTEGDDDDNGTPQSKPEDTEDEEKVEGAEGTEDESRACDDEKRELIEEKRRCRQLQRELMNKELKKILTN